MPLDGFTLSNIVSELNTKLPGGRINKIYQPLAHEIILQIYHEQEQYRLLLNVQATAHRIHLTTHQKQNPARPPMFCMLLRKHIVGGRIISIEQHQLERLIKIFIATKDELGNPTQKVLIGEFMGKYSNIILINPETGKIYDSLKRVPFGVSRVRQVLPGFMYHLPTSFNKKDVLSERFDSPIESPEDPVSFLVQNYAGISPLLAQELLYRRQTLTGALTYLQKILTTKAFEPSITCRQNKCDFSALNLTHLGGSSQLYTSMNQALDVYYRRKERNARYTALKQRLKRTVRDLEQKTTRKLHKQKRAYEDAQRNLKYKRLGDLIKTNLYQIPEGQSEVQVIDYYSPEMEKITISLNPNRTPQQNLKNYYHKYEKARRTIADLSSRLEQAQSEIDCLASTLFALDTAEEIEELEAIATELKQEGLLASSRKAPSTTKEEKPLKPRKFLTEDQTIILVGRNNFQNDYLTLRKAHKNDLWLHTKDIPGSHVIIQCQGRAVSDNTLRQAARLAAYYSKARQSSNVPVDYTQVKYVRKPRGARPGKVIYTQQKTLYVTPSANGLPPAVDED